MCEDFLKKLFQNRKLSRISNYLTYKFSCFYHGRLLVELENLKGMCWGGL